MELSLRLLMLATLLWAVPPVAHRQDPTMPSLSSLRDLGEFPVTLSGQSFESFPSKRLCLYGEWTLGTKVGETWSERQATRSSDQLLHVTTPKGAIDLRHGQVRLYVAGGGVRTYKREDATAPEFVREFLDTHPVLMLEEVVLTAGTKYYARVNAESYWLPPTSPGGEPHRQQNLVLSISDLPFKDGKPQRPLAPSFLDIVY